MIQPSQNAPCPCGSGKKYKRCCGAPASRKADAVRADAESKVRLAMQAYEAGDFAKAEHLLDRVLGAYPDDPGLLGMKGMASLGQGDAQRALGVLAKAVSLSPGDSRLYNFLGQAHLAKKNHIEAERTFGKAVTLDPGFAEAWFNLGKSQLAMHKPDEAVHSFIHLVRLQPNDGELHLQLAEAYYFQRQVDLALNALRNAARLGVPETSVLPWEMAILHCKGCLDAVKECADRLDSLCGDANSFAAALIRIANADSLVGNMEAAQCWLGMILAKNPDDIPAFVELAQTRKFTQADRSLVDNMVKSFGICPAEKKRGLAFALGKVHSDLGEFDRSFHYYKAGNDLVRAVVPFDMAEYREQVREIINRTLVDNLERMPSGSESNLPIFIVGTPRSGTTLTEQIISSHSSVGAAGEMDVWPRLAPLLINNYTLENARQAAQGCLELMRQQAPKALHVTDKMPANFQFLGIMHAVFPHARIVHVKRHPIDACLSIYFQNFNDGHAYKWDLESLAAWYEQYQCLMAHWREVLPPGTLLEFWYEDLVEDTEGVSRQIMEFLELEWEPGQLDFYKQDRAVFTASKWQARQPIYKSSKERWRRYEKHLGPLLGLLKYARP